MKQYISLKYQLENLGFSNSTDILKTIEELPDPDAGVESTKLLCYDYSDPQDIGFIFSFKKQELSSRWKIDSITASYQMETERLPEGVMVIEKTYGQKDMQTPTKDQIRKEILQKVKIQEFEESEFIGRTTLHEIISKHSKLKNSNSHFDSKLDDLFKSIGFDNYKQFSNSAIFENNLFGEEKMIFFKDSMQINHPIEKDEYQINFLFGVAKVEQFEFYFFKNVFVWLDQKPEDKFTAEVDYWPWDNPLPEKLTMIQSVLEISTMNKLRAKFNLNNDKDGKEPYVPQRLVRRR